MTAGEYFVCVAGPRATANSHYVPLERTFILSPVDYDVKRVAQGSGPHNITVQGLGAGDTVFFSQDICTGGAQLATGQAPADSSTASIIVPSTLPAGSFQLCHTSEQHGTQAVPDMNLTVRPQLCIAPHSSASPLTADFKNRMACTRGNPWHHLYDAADAHISPPHFRVLLLQVQPLPSFTPLGGQAGEPTLVTMALAASGDFVVLRASTSCAGASTVLTNSTTLGKTALSSEIIFSTSAAMSVAAILTVCYATSESQGNVDTDFVALSTRFVQSSVTFDTARVLEGSGPHTIRVAGLADQDKLMFATRTCDEGAQLY